MSPQLSHPKAERGKTAVLQVGHIYPRKCDRYAMSQTLGHNIISQEICSRETLKVRDI